MFHEFYEKFYMATENLSPLEGKGLSVEAISGKRCGSRRVNRFDDAPIIILPR